MSTLVLVLTAAMAVPGNGPAPVSAEMEERLDLRGEWEGKFWDYESRVHKAKLRGECLLLERPNEQGRYRWEFTDEGGGKGRVRWTADDYLSIYRQEGDGITICYRLASKGRPPSFRTGDGHFLLILHRVKPRK